VKELSTCTSCAWTAEGLTTTPAFNGSSLWAAKLESLLLVTAIAIFRFSILSPAPAGLTAWLFIVVRVEFRTSLLRMLGRTSLELDDCYSAISTKFML